MAYRTNRKERLPADWQARRRFVFERDEDRCQLQIPDVCTVVATQVDHIVNNDDNDYANLQAVCRPCHLKKSAGEATVARRSIAAQRFRPAQRHPGMLP